MRQFRKGDIVTIECVVESQFTDRDLRVRPVQGHTDIYVAPDQAKIVRQAISVGDFVSEDGSDITKGTVIAIHNNSAWVQFSDLSGYSTFELDELGRVESIEAQVAA